MKPLTFEQWLESNYGVSNLENSKIKRSKWGYIRKEYDSFCEELETQQEVDIHNEYDIAIKLKSLGIDPDQLVEWLNEHPRLR